MILLPLIGGIPNIERLQFAVAALPGYREALEIASACDEWLNTPPELPTVEPALAEQISDAWIDAERARETALAEYKERRRIVQSRRQVEANRAQSIFTTGADLVLSSLQSDLTKLLRRAAEILPALDGATTPTEAIVADAGAAWKRLTELADEYAELRRAQTFVMTTGAMIGLWQSSTPRLPAEDHANQAFIRNIDDLWPNWRQYGLDRRAINLSDNAKPARGEPWPADQGPQLLLFLLTSDAEPWIPTPGQLRELWTERNAPVDDSPKQSDDESSVFDSLLYGPLEAERQRQAEANERSPSFTGHPPPILA